MTQLIKNWEELAQVPESETHRLEVGDYNGWVITKNPKSESFMDREQYLSTHTFYGSEHESSTRRLQACGFDIEIDNWDKE